MKNFINISLRSSVFFSIHPSYIEKPFNLVYILCNNSDTKTYHHIHGYIP
ncbi:Uncharacterised protein [Morganella morganii]|nr:Uncharacterised protein [Morganella morganii]